MNQRWLAAQQHGAQNIAVSAPNNERRPPTNVLLDNRLKIWHRSEQGLYF